MPDANPASMMVNAGAENQRRAKKCLQIQCLISQNAGFLIHPSARILLHRQAFPSRPSEAETMRAPAHDANAHVRSTQMRHEVKQLQVSDSFTNPCPAFTGCPFLSLFRSPQPRGGHFLLISFPLAVVVLSANRPVVSSTNWAPTGPRRGARPALDSGEINKTAFDAGIVHPLRCQPGIAILPATIKPALRRFSPPDAFRHNADNFRLQP